jgi:hypothetical protein
LLLRAKGTIAEQDVHSSHFGLGFDGKRRWRRMLNTPGVGAEQVASFGLWTGITIQRGDIIIYINAQRIFGF